MRSCGFMATAYVHYVNKKSVHQTEVFFLLFVLFVMYVCDVFVFEVQCNRNSRTFGVHIILISNLQISPTGRSQFFIYERSNITYIHRTSTSASISMCLLFSCVRVWSVMHKT